MIETVKLKEPDLVIMGTQGATGAKEILLGTHTWYTLSKKATCRVSLILSYEYESNGTLFLTDYEIDYQKEHLQQLLDIAKNHNGSIEVIHVSSGHQPDGKPIEEQTKTKGCCEGTAYSCSTICRARK